MTEPSGGDSSSSSVSSSSSSFLELGFEHSNVAESGATVSESDAETSISLNQKLDELHAAVLSVPYLPSPKHDSDSQSPTALLQISSATSGSSNGLITASESESSSESTSINHRYLNLLNSLHKNLGSSNSNGNHNGPGLLQRLRERELQHRRKAVISSLENWMPEKNRNSILGKMKVMIDCDYDF